MRSKLPISILLLVLALFVAISGTAIGSGATPSPTYRFELSITPDQQVSGVYLAKLVIKDLTANTSVAEPTIRFRAGDHPNTVSGESANKLNYQFSVEVNETGDAAKYDASVSQGGAVISASQGTISLRK